MSASPDVEGYVIEASNLELSFGETPALRGVDLHVRRGETVALMGPSGSGKSTLLHCLAGILRPDQGHIRTTGQLITECSEAERSHLRLTRMGFVFQFGDLIPELTLIENVALPLQLTGATRRAATSRAAQLLVELGIADTADRRAGAVSGGQAQRAAVARALITQPEVIFADEPTGSLDSTSGEEVLDMLINTADEIGSAVVIVTHDHQVAAYAERHVVMRDGRIRQPSSTAK